MICLDSSFLVDHFRGREYTQSYLEGVDGNVSVIVPSIVLHELFTGALRSGRIESISEIRESLGGTRFVPFGEKAAEEAAVIRSTLADRGELINPLDILIAGVARHIGATMVAIDRDYARIPDLEAVDPRK